MRELADFESSAARRRARKSATLRRGGQVLSPPPPGSLGPGQRAGNLGGGLTNLRLYAKGWTRRSQPPSFRESRRFASPPPCRLYVHLLSLRQEVQD